MPCKTVLAAEVAKQFIDDISSTIKERNLEAKLVGYLANKDPAAVKYAEYTKRTCEETGIKFELIKVNREMLEDTIIKANEDESVHGIMVYYPVFGGGHDQYLQNLVSPYKDVEGLCHMYRFNMYHNHRYLDSEKTLKSIIPCTPLAIVKILEYCKAYNTVVPYGNQLHGKIITIVNRSEVVGRPLAALLANDGAKVYSVDVSDVLEFTRGSGLRLRKHEVKDTELFLEQILPLSDIVVGGVPKSDYRISTDLLKEGVIAINFASAKNFEESITEKASIYVLTVGKVTISMLQRNLLRLRQYQLDHPDKIK